MTLLGPEKGGDLPREFYQIYPNGITGNTPGSRAILGREMPGPDSALDSESEAELESGLPSKTKARYLRARKPVRHLRACLLGTPPSLSGSCSGSSVMVPRGVTR